MDQFEQILTDEHIATPEQLNEARQRREVYGGTLEEHLFRLGYVTRPDLLRALSDYCGCDAVDPARIEIPEATLTLIPPDLAWRLKVLPFHLDPESNTLQIACEDPANEDMQRELRNRLPDFALECHAALPSALKCRLLDVYRSAPDKSEAEPTVQAAAAPRGNFLMVSPFPEADHHLARALAAEGNRVVLVDSIGDATSEIDAERFSAILIRDSDVDRYRPLVDRCRLLSLSTPVRFYSSLSDLAGVSTAMVAATRLIAANLRLCIGLLCSEEEISAGRAARTGQYVEQVCRLLNLPPQDRISITNAAYLCDLARLYLGDTQSPEWQSALQQQGNGAVGTFAFPPFVLDILRKMNSDELSRYPDRLTLEDLGGNILKLVDHYLRLWPNTEKISPGQFETVRQQLRDRSGTVYLEEVVEAFLTVLHFDAADGPAHHSGCDVLIYTPDGRDTIMLGACLQNLGFDVLTAGTLDSFVHLYETAWPDFLVLLAPGTADEAADIVASVIAHGVMIDRAPTFLLAEAAGVDELHFLLQAGLEDVVPLDGDLDPLLVKMARVRSRHEMDQRDRLMAIRNIGTHGSLEDMNIIDLLQAMGHSEKTLRISVTGCAQQLTMFLERGTLRHAVCDDLLGAQAVYEAIGWRNGIWSVDPIGPEDLPEPNVCQSIDSILIEGCRLLDEASHGEPGANGGAAQFDADASDSLF